ncbi:hypothetical protein CDFC105_43927 [Clostridioides difficile]|nr:hypothetical protein CDFC105_43927 [Clostridioides difficile]
MRVVAESVEDVSVCRGVVLLPVLFFFFKQKTAYEIMPSLVGSEMCIRDRVKASYTSAKATTCADIGISSPFNPSG